MFEDGFRKHDTFARVCYDFGSLTPTQTTYSPLLHSSTTKDPRGSPDTFAASPSSTLSPSRRI